MFILKYLGIALLLFLLYVVIALIHGTLTDFKPDEVTKLELDNPSGEKVITDSVLTFANWNVGYSGLGAESNFFYDSGGFLTSKGKMIRAPRKNVEKNLAGALDFIQKNKADFYLFQEVDKKSKRSYRINTHAKYAAQLPNYTSTFAVNYKSARVPLPVLEFWRVMGRMESGLGTYSRYQATEATRYQFPGNYPWPDRIFHLDRCFAAHRYPTASGQELIVINTHNSAYDDGTIKAQQMEYLKKYLETEYNKNNYLIVGGDWNQCPPGVRFDMFKSVESGEDYSQINIEEDYLPRGWKWAYDTKIPTNRKLTDTYKKGETFTTLIDFYLVSPNVEIIEVQGVDQDFQFSDHQPVMMKVRLR